MWDTFVDWFFVGLKSFGSLYLIGIFLAIARHFYVKRVNAKIFAYAERLIKQYSVTWTNQGPHYVNQKTEDIGRTILRQLLNGVQESRRHILYHASLHQSIFLRTTIFLPYHISDVNVYHAFEVLKYKFYQTYGTFLNGNGGLRNNIKFEPLTNEGHNLGVLIEGRSLEDIVGHFERAKINPETCSDGFKLIITVSIPTPETSKSYDFSRHCM